MAHYFGDKDGLLEAAFRTLARTLAARVRERLALARTPRGRVQAVIDTNLAPEEFDQRSATAWLAFWGQVPHVKGLKRVQSAYQRRMLSNLRNDLRRMIPGEDARSLAAMIAAMIDGVWLRAALSQWQEADSGSARALLTAFVEGRLKDLARTPPAPTAAAAVRPAARDAEETGAFRVINPATGALLAELTADGPAQIEAAVAQAQAAQKKWAALTGAERGRVLHRAAQLLRARNEELAQLETRNTGKPIQETRAVDVLSGAECLEYYAGLAAGLCRRASGPGHGGFRLHAPRAARRGRRYRRLELSAADRLLEVRPGARLRQCHDLQARRAHPAHGDEAGGDLSRRRTAAGSLPGGAGSCADRAAADAPPRRSARSPSPGRSGPAKPSWRMPPRHSSR